MRRESAEHRRHLTREQLAQLQAESAASDLTTLVGMCRRRFLQASHLLELRSEAVDSLREMGWSQRIDVGPLLPAWGLLCERYIRERWSDQMPLIDDPDFDAATLWSRFVHWHLLPILVREDEVVRNVLRAVGGIPCVERNNAAEALRLYLAEMPLPGNRPLWAPEEGIDE